MDSKRHEAYRTAILRAQGASLEGIYPGMTRVVEAVVAVADAENDQLHAEYVSAVADKWAEHDRAQALLEENTRLSDALEDADLRFQREVESLKLAHSKIVNALREELARDQ